MVELLPGWWLDGRTTRVTEVRVRGRTVFVAVDVHDYMFGRNNSHRFPSRDAAEEWATQLAVRNGD